MKTATIKAVITCLTLLYWNVAISGGTVQKCVDEKGHVTFAERCTANQQATDTGVVIDSRSAEQKAEDEASHKKSLDDLIDKQSKATPTAVPVAQPAPSDTELTPTETPDQDDDSYECLSQTRNCLGYNRPNLTPEQKAAILKKVKASQLPAKIKRR